MCWFCGVTDYLSAVCTEKNIENEGPAKPSKTTGVKLDVFSSAALVQKNKEHRCPRKASRL